MPGVRDLRFAAPDYPPVITHVATFTARMVPDALHPCAAVANHCRTSRWGRDMVRESAEVRREKQRLRQRAYRARKRNERMPSYEDLARAALDVALTYNLKHGRHQQLLDLLEAVRRRLREIGFHERDTTAVWFELEDRYQRGWTMLRPRRSIAEMEAEGLPDAGDSR